MTGLTISWQRLVDSGETCPRCADTGLEVRKAAATLSAALAPLGLTVHLDESVVAPEEFEQTPLESNRIFIDGRSLEDWLHGQVGHSCCCDVCGPNDCRTVTVDGVAHETIPAALLVRAGLARRRGVAHPGRAPAHALLRPRTAASHDPGALHALASLLMVGRLAPNASAGRGHDSARLRPRAERPGDQCCSDVWGTHE